MFRLRGIDADVANLLSLSGDTADLDGVAVDDADDLDYGWITLG